MQTLATLLDGEADAVMVIRDERRTTRAELQKLAAALAAELGDRTGRAVGVCMPNCAEAVAAWFAIWQAGAAFVPLNPRVPEEERERAIDQTGCVAVVTYDDGWRVRACTPSQPREVERGAAIIQFTSGTTGRPKAVVLRHDTVSDLLDSVIGSLRGGRDKKAQMPNIVPMSLALWAGIYQVLFACKLGVPVVLMEQFEPREFVRLVRAHNIRSSVLPPAALVMLCQDPEIDSLAPLAYIRSVSAPLSPAQARRFHERFGIAILNGYGQTELGGEAVGWTASDWKAHGLDKVGSVGRPHDAFQVRIASGEGEDIGELEIKSSSALPPADAAMEGRVTDDGWLRTGDIARIDDDGFVWIEGRVSDMINRGGLKVFPDEVEEVVRAVPGVIDAAVAAAADDRLGEVPVAYVVAPASVTDDVLESACRARLAPYKVPVAFHRIEALPRNEAGKVLRRSLQA
jgi:acyl-CoA synthetase (AMP-forming)/AMP-acid ligase II